MAEALTCGVPVVSTDIAEYEPWCRHGVYTYKDADELKALLRRVLTHIDGVKTSLEERSDVFRQQFSWKRLAQRYEAVVYALLRK